MIDSLRITKEVIESISHNAMSSPFESGGILGANQNGVITEFFFDSAPIESSEFTYIPNVCSFNDVISGKWSEKSIKLAGFVHSHRNNTLISDEDVSYMREVIKSINSEKIICGVVNVSAIRYALDFVKWYVVGFDSVDEVESVLESR